MDTPNSNTPPPPGQQPIPPTGQPAPPAYGGAPQQPAPPQQAPPPQQPPPQAQPQPGYAAAPPPAYGNQQPAYPQQPGQQPGFGVPPGGAEPPKKKRRWWIWILAILFAFALLIGGCGLVIFNAVKGPIDKSNEMLSLLVDGEVEEATDLLDFDCFGNDGLDDFEDFFNSNPVESYDLTGSSNSNGNRGEATGFIELDDGLGERPIALSLTKDDDWEICGIDIDEP